MRKAFIYTLLLVSIFLTLTSAKKFKQKIVGDWWETRMDIKFEDPVMRNYIHQEQFHFDKDGTGYRIFKNDETYARVKVDGYADTSSVIDIDYKIFIPFTYSLREDDIGNMITINYRKGTIKYVDTTKAQYSYLAAKKIVDSSMNKYEKFYWKIEDDPVEGKGKSLQFLHPGTSKKRIFSQMNRKDEIK